MTSKEITIGLAQISQQVGDSFYFPYSVGLLQAYAQCNAPPNKQYNFLPLVYHRLTVSEALAHFAGADIIGFSLYIWNMRRSLALALALKQEDPQRLIIVGGPQVPDQAEAFLRANPQIDLCCHGPGEITFLDLLATWPERDWQAIAGISYIQDDQFFYNPPAPRERDLSLFPSPYLEGVFDPLLTQNQHWIGLLETNRGCPFACTFCDWGSAIQSKVYRFPLERVFAEIEWIARHKVGNVFTCDANFGILSRDVEIAHYVARMKQAHGFPLTFQNQTAKNASERVIEIQRILHQAGLATYAAISLQSVDPYTLQSIKRENISLAAYRKVQNAALEAGIVAYTDMILALPGESYASFVAGINTVIENGQHTKILFHNTTLLPNAEMAAPAYRAKFGLETTWVNLPGHTPAEDGIPELMEIVVASKDLSRTDWQKTHVFAWTLACFYYTHKLLQPLLMVLHETLQTAYTDLILAVLEADLSQYPVLHKIRERFIHTAQQFQQGYPHSQQNTLIWTLFDGMYLTPDNAIQIELWNAGLIDTFYSEIGAFYARWALQKKPDFDLRLLDESLMFNRRLFMRIFASQRFPVATTPRSIPDQALPLHYNLQEFYQKKQQSKEVCLQETPETLLRI
jgi:radical SAM superfamily enzyme YgiQ (UPF0313 family)